MGRCEKQGGNLDGMSMSGYKMMYRKWMNMDEYIG
jgi:hypothetical protein